MIRRVFYFLCVVACVQSCYWNAECPYQLYSTKTPYDTIRGDIRDITVPQNCEAVSIWSLNRHGNKNPGDTVLTNMKYVASLKDEILESYATGRSQLCAQDIENLRKWTWNDTIEVSQLYLTEFGYEELYDIGKRIRQKYSHLLQGTDQDYYFRPTNEQRTVASAMAFVHGLTEGTNLTLTPDAARARDDVIRPYWNCNHYQEYRSSSVIEDQLEAYFRSAEFKNVQEAVQHRLGIFTQLTPDNIYAFYELCRFDRSWTVRHQSPWCAVFSDQDLVVLEYKDDVRHYYKNGYGFWANANLGGPAMKDLIENLEDAVNGGGRKIVSYFTHDTMIEMVYCALGLFRDRNQLQGSYRDPNRIWKTSSISAFAVNIVAVLNRCRESDIESHRVQFFINEKESEVCPLEGCNWQQFQQKFKIFKEANLNFCTEPARNRY